jgi:GlpG protein
MRKIAECAEKKQARVFGDYLGTLGMECDVRETQGGGASVWVYDEDQLARAEQEFKAFREHPEAEIYAKAAREAEAARKAKPAAPAAAPRAEMPPMWRTQPTWGQIPLTVTLMAVSVGVSLLTSLGQDPQMARWFYFLPDRLEQGEYWRVISPIFLHLGVLHIVFNMIWLRELGGMVEVLRGRWYLVLLVSLLGIGSNYMQYRFVGPHFGGMSGVLYGLLGYIWVKGRREPWSGFIISNTTMVWMLGWMLLGWVGDLAPQSFVPAMANWAHTGGLMLGVVAGSLDSLTRRGGLR